MVEDLGVEHTCREAQAVPGAAEFGIRGGVEVIQACLIKSGPQGPVFGEDAPAVRQRRYQAPRISAFFEASTSYSAAIARVVFGCSGCIARNSPSLSCKVPALIWRQGFSGRVLPKVRIVLGCS